MKAKLLTVARFYGQNGSKLHLAGHIVIIMMDFDSYCVCHDENDFVCNIVKDRLEIINES